jgi:thiol-disulfide isomerase/thioredoxin
LTIAVLTMSMAFSVRGQTQPADWEFPRDWFGHDDDAQRAKHAELVGKPMPPLTVTDWINGEVKPQDMKGKVVVIDLWGTWCDPCIAAIPKNNELMQRWGEDVIIIGVCTSKQGQEDYEKVVKEKGIKYHACRDPDCKTLDAYRVMFYPTYAVIDKKGNLRAIGLYHERILNVVEKLLKE